MAKLFAMCQVRDQMVNEGMTVFLNRPTVGTQTRQAFISLTWQGRWSEQWNAMRAFGKWLFFQRTWPISISCFWCEWFGGDVWLPGRQLLLTPLSPYEVDMQCHERLIRMQLGGKAMTKAMTKATICRTGHHHHHHSVIHRGLLLHFTTTSHVQVPSSIALFPVQGTKAAPLNRSTSPTIKIPRQSPSNLVTIWRQTALVHKGGNPLKWRCLM